MKIEENEIKKEEEVDVPIKKNDQPKVKGKQKYTKKQKERIGKIRNDLVKLGKKSTVDSELGIIKREVK